MNITDNGCVVVIGHEPIKVFVNVDFKRFRYANRFFKILFKNREKCDCLKVKINKEKKRCAYLTTVCCQCCWDCGRYVGPVAVVFAVKLHY